jgi:uncharacterized protein involved in exopolysaccharide biosynthesis
MRVVGPEQAPSPRPEVAAETRARAAEELSLWDFIDPVLGSWRWIAVIAAIGAGLAYMLASLQRSVYEATAVVRIAESKTGDQVEAVRAENFRPLLENRTIAAELIREFGITGESTWKFLSGSRPIAADSFLQNHVNVEQVTGTNLLRLSVRLGDRERAAKVANELVERGVALNRRISQQEVVEARDYIKTQLDEAAKRLETVRTDLLALKQKSQVDALKADTKGALDVRAGLLTLQTSIAYERAFLATSEAELKVSQQLLTTRRMIDRNPALMEAAREQGAGGSVLGLELSEQQVNDAYSKLQEQIAQSRAKLAGLERQRMLIDDKRLDGAELPGLSRLYDSELAIARRQSEYEMELKVYSDLATKHEDARIRVGSRGAQLQLVDPAVPPSSRVSPRVMATAQLGGVLGLLLGCLLVLGRHFFYRHRLA